MNQNSGSWRRTVSASRAALILLTALGSIAGWSFGAQADTQGYIYTVAGGGVNDGNGGPATSARLNGPASVSVDNSGNIFISDGYSQRIRMVTGDTGIISSVAGNSNLGFSGDGGAATSASLNMPSSATLDPLGNVYIADAYNNRIRKVAAGSGIITTVAGNGSPTFSGDGGAAVLAALNTPSDVAEDSAGNVYIADTYNNRIRKIDPSGIITTIAGTGSAGFSGDGGPATAAMLNTPYGVALDRNGNLYIADTWNDRIRKVAAGTGIITTIAGNGATAYAGDGGPATSASLSSPIMTTVSSAGNLYIADAGNNRVRKVAAGSGTITTVAGNGSAGYAGDGGPATSAKLNEPTSVAIDANGNLYIADTANNLVRKVVTADTAAPPAFSLTVAKNGSGGGYVASDAGSISCGPTCSASVTSGTTVTLTATPDFSSYFGGWGGDCSGTGPCTISMTGAHNVTATFNQQSATPVTTNLLSNWGFEGGLSSWSEYSSGNYDVITNNTAAGKAFAHGGSWFAWLGGYNSATDYIYQDITIPAEAGLAYLQFWLRIYTDETSSSANDKMYIDILNPVDGSLWQTIDVWSNLDYTGGWVLTPQYDLSAYRGMKVRLAFYAATDAANYTSWLVDDTVLNSTTDSSCSYTISNVTNNFTSDGGSGSFDVITSGNCGWTVTAPGWISFTSGTTGSGSKTVFYTVSQNTGSSDRSGVISIGDQQITIIQSGVSGACSYTLAVSNLSFGGSSGSGRIKIVPSSSSCNPDWSASADVPWITFNTTCSTGTCPSATLSGSGASMITFLIAANGGSSSRTGHISILGKTIPITQQPEYACTTCSRVFSDISPTDWAYDAISGIGCAGVTQGCGNGAYCPGDFVTREQMAAFLVRAKEGEPPADYGQGSSGFSDVPFGSSFANYVHRLKDLQITTGCGNGNYCPSNLVTREQMAVFLVRAVEGEPPADYCAAGSPFSDVNQNSVYCRYIKRLKELGITSGTGNNTYSPSDNVTRQQMAAFLYRAFLRGSCGSQQCYNASANVLVTNSQTGAPVAGATVQIGTQSALTNSNGVATITGLTAGQNLSLSLPVQVSASGFVTGTTTVGVTCGSAGNASISLLPVDTGTQRGDIRVILNWGDSPADLDLHLNSPKKNSSERAHVYWSLKNNCSGAACDSSIPAWLDVDQTQGYGPERVTIMSNNGAYTPGVYHFSVHHYAGTSNIPNSHALIRVYQGDRLLKSYSPPVPASGETVTNKWVWTAFDVNIDAGNNVTLSDIGTYSGPVNTSSTVGM